MQLNWGDIVEIEPGVYQPPRSLEQEIEAFLQGGRWVSDSFLDNEYGDLIVSVQLNSPKEGTGTSIKTKLTVSYFNAKNNEPFKTVLDDKEFSWTLEEVAGQRLLSVMLGDQPTINDQVFSYSLDGDSLGIMRLRPPGQPKEKGEPPFQTGTLRFKATNPIAAIVASPGQQQAAAWFEAINNADLEKVASLVEVPFSMDRRSVLKTKDELLAIHRQMVESNGKRPIPKYTIAPTQSAPKLDASLFPHYEAYRISIGGEGVDIYVSSGENPKVIGFSD